MSKLKHLFSSLARHDPQPDPRAQAEAIVEEGTLKRARKEARVPVLSKIWESCKPQNSQAAEDAQEARNAQEALDVQRAKHKAPFPDKENDGDQSALAVMDCDADPTPADERLMLKLNITLRGYGKLPASLVEKLKEFRADQNDNCLVRFVGSARQKAAAGLNSRSEETPINGTKEKTPGEKRPVYLVLAHPSIRYAHAARELAYDIVEEIKQGKKCSIDRSYRFEDQQLLGRPGRSQPPPPKMVNKLAGGRIHVIHIDEYHDILTTTPKYDASGKRIKPPRKPFGCSRQDHARRDAIKNNITADVDGEKVFIITDRLKHRSACSTVALYKEHVQVISKRVLVPIYLNCAEGRYTSCLFSRTEVETKTNNAGNADPKHAAGNKPPGSRAGN
ncbi:hypothetical protein F503_02910 [Ophiostoma piceae UAMH 11346]|uniref:Uncharacterized protein n=1 Tax=Ophiostoma piceae (strain UAMH 11346) TaxID=1262450 RepID=S3C2T5_OPHP1|nr:hypothetical protein F503_02910 [Ophiostoma piceae UAMH 11346]